MTKTPLHQIPRHQALFNTIRFVKNPLGLLNDTIMDLGPSFFTYIGGMYRGLVTIDPDLIQHVLQKNHRNYRKAPMHFDKLAHFLGNGLLTSEGEYWLRQRRLIQPGFHRARLAALVGLMQEVIDEFLTEFDEVVAQREQVDIAPYMMQLAFDVVARSLFSVNLAGEELRRLGDIITQLQAFVIRQIRQPYLEPWRRVSGQLQQHERLAEEFKSKIIELIQQRRASNEQHDDLLQMLLDARYEDTGNGMTDQQLYEESAILFVAGHETSANALAWTWYLLAQHPDVVAKARAELDAVLGDQLPAFENLPRLEYLTQVIEESMRLYPPAWITDRVAAADDEFQGISIPKGTMVVTYFYGLHHSPLLWEEPESFRPERFHKDERKRLHPFAYAPFGGGPRLCIGNNFAIMEMQLILSAMLRRYDFAVAPGLKIIPQPLVTLRPKGGIPMHWRKRVA